MGNGNNGESTSPECMTDEALCEIQSQIDRLDDNIHVEYPAADTPVGGEQRVRIEVRSPASVLTLGAQGWNATEGYPFGPGGIAILSSQSFGAQIANRTCLTSCGLTIIHSADAMRLLTQQDIGIASTHAIRIGTTNEHVEITAGDVVARDPQFTVAPAMDIPDAPPVDTSGPRQSTETDRSTLSALWTTLDTASSLRSLASAIRSGLASGVAGSTRLARVMGAVNAATAAYSILAAVRDAAIAAGALLDAVEPDSDAAGDPKVKIHGAGGVELTTPATVSGFGSHISLAGSQTVSIKAPLKVSLKSAGHAGLYGGATVSVSAEGPAVLKSGMNAATVSGKYAEITAKETAAITSKKDGLISADEALVLKSPKIDLSGTTEIALSSDTIVEIGAPIVSTTARDQNIVWSDRDVEVKAKHRITLGKTSNDYGDITSGIEVVDGKITIDPGGRHYMQLERDSVRLMRVRLTPGEASIHGLVVRR